jgi:hypothetical protein
MKTMSQQWGEYFQACYPDGCPPDQKVEVHQAFFSGGLCAFTTMQEISGLDETEGVKELQKMSDEIHSVCRDRAETMENRN